MPFTTKDFLDALNLPEEHPYVADDNGVETEKLKPWSVADYFSSVSSPFNHVRSIKECSKFSLSPWGNKDLAECDNTGANIGDYNDKALNSDKVSFFQEIQPCLISMCRLAILLWAPIVLLLCLKRLTAPHRHNRADTNTSSTQDPRNCLIDLTVMKRNSISTESNSSNTNQTFVGNKTIDRYISPTPFFANVISVLSNSTPMFSIDDRVEKQQASSTKSKSSLISAEDCSSCTGVGDPLAFVIAILVSAIIMMDAMYILEFSQSTLIGLHFLIISIGMKRLGPKTALVIALPITTVSFFKMQHQDLDLPSIQPGLYFSESNPLISKAIQHHWPVESRTYEGKGTPWMITGDTRTGLPFLLYPQNTNVQYVRRWVPLPEEQEALILDIAFPKSDNIENSRTVYLIVHGINGHSNEGYVLDFARQQIAEGNIVAVMVTRGLMDSPILGSNLLHFARTSDVDAAAKALKAAMTKVRHNPNSPENGPMLVGVGYSMGAITLANYVARAGQNCALDIAIGFSGALDTREQLTFHRSASLWQPFIAKAMRDTLIGKFLKQIESKLDQEQYNEMMRATSLVELDRTFFALYNDFDGLEDYYSNTGAMGDFGSFDKKQGRIANVSIPLLMVQSLDDPVGTWRSFHDPNKSVATGSGNTVILFTRKGGHVGWPQGINPRLHGWSWMNNVASSFVRAIGQAQSDVASSSN